MPRKLKPYLVSHVKDATTGNTFDIMLDREDKVFFAHVLGERIEAATAEDCEKLALEHIKTTTKMEWKKIIQVNTPSRHSSEIQLSFDVHEIAKKVLSDTSVRCNHTKRTLRPTPGPTAADTHYYQDFYAPETRPEAGIFVFSWSEELEAALKDIQRHIKETRKAIEQALSQKNAAEHLSKIGWGILTTRKGEKE